MEEIWLKFEKKLHAFAMSKVNNKSVADDIMQELFIRIHANIDKVKDETKIQSWIFQICRNLIVDYYRQQTKKEAGSISLSEEDEELNTDEVMSEALEDMVNMMENLPPEYCEALCLTELGTLSQKEYAEKVGISYSGA